MRYFKHPTDERCFYAGQLAPINSDGESWVTIGSSEYDDLVTAAAESYNKRQGHAFADIKPTVLTVTQINSYKQEAAASG